MRGQNGVKNQKVVIFLPRLLGVSLLLHEGAPTLIGRFIADGSVDELFLTVAFQVADRNAGAANCSNNTSFQDEGHRPMAISSARAYRGVARSSRLLPADGNTAGPANHRDASLGLGLCQQPSEAMSASASFGPQLRRL